MWAVVEIAKKQYLVKKGESLKVEKLKDLSGEIVFDKVLVLVDGDKVVIGKPYVDKAKVKASIEGQVKEKKVIIYKHRRRKKYRKTQGHRQVKTLLKISNITTSAK